VAEAEGVAHLVHRRSFEVETLAARRNHAAQQRHGGDEQHEPHGGSDA